MQSVKSNIITEYTLTGLRIKIHGNRTITMDDVIHISALVEYIIKSNETATVSYFPYSGLFKHSWCSLSKVDTPQDVVFGILSALSNDPAAVISDDVRCYINIVCESILLEKQ